MSQPSESFYKNGKSPASSELDEAVLFIGNSAEQTVASCPKSGVKPYKPLLTNTLAENPSGSAAGRTVFPVHPHKQSVRTCFYNLTHYYFAGATLFRWSIILLSVLLGILLWVWPGYWILSIAIWASLIAGLLLWRSNLHNHDYVRFEVDTTPNRKELNKSEPMPPNQKVPVHVTGLFSVEGREARLTWLPGFYRTFATREHALLCQQQENLLLRVARPDEEMIGMWYIFFLPQAITQMRLGNLYFGSTPALAIAVTHQIEVKTKGRFGRDKVNSETLYMAFLDETERWQVWSDLQADKHK